MGAHCSGVVAAPLADSDSGVDAVEVVAEPSAAEPTARDPAEAREEAVPGEPGKEDGASSSTEAQSDAVVGEWRTKFGIYSIALNNRMELDFQEKNLHGVLQAEQDWYTAEIRDGAQADKVFGYLRLRREGKIIRSYFKEKPEDPWENSKPIEAKPLPYLHVGAAAAAEAMAGGAELPWQQSTCCICFEALDGGDDFAELQCHHMFHKSCIRSWFMRSGSCPMRCAHS